MAKKIEYFAGANTSAGFVSYFDYVLKDAARVYIIKGGPGCGKSLFMKRLGEAMLAHGCDVEFVYCSADAGSLDAIYIHGMDVAVVDGTAPHVIDPKYPGAVERILDFGQYWDIDLLRSNKDIIVKITNEISDEYKKYYEHLKIAKVIHDNWEKEYLKGMDFNMAEDITKGIIKKIIVNNKGCLGKETHRFAGALTPQGQISFYEELTEGIANRYIVKGRPGTGKSTMNKKIAVAALNAGYNVEYYHCAFDPNSIDMIIIPELSFAILDGTAPHVMDPSQKDTVVDTFKCIDTVVVQEDKDPIKQIEKDYVEELARAKKSYKRIKELHDILEKFYIAATDFNEVNALRVRIEKELKSL